MDMRYRTVFYGVGLEHHEGVNARQWAEWGFDYLKYDWTPCDVENADLMKRELLSTDRDFAFCVTVKAELRDVEYWRKNCTSWRNNTDSADTWEVFKDICFGYDHMLPYAKKGHYFDLDMLEVGYMFDHRCALSESEQMMAFTVRAIFPSPIQLSLDFSKLTDFEYALICNEEVIAVNQDELCLGAVCLSEEKSCSPDGKLQKHIKIYSKTLADGTSAVAVFNIGSTSERISIPAAYARDLWQKRDEIVADGEISILTEPHTVRLFKIKA
jgi:alpha-galactosidase